MKAKLPFTVVMPAYNEEQGIAKVIDEIMGYADSLIVVDDGSKDRTRQIAEESARKHSGVSVISYPKNKGKVGAILTGIAKAKTEAVVLIDADYTYPAKDIPRLVSKMEQGSDLVLANRFSIGRKNIPAFNRVGNGIFSFLISFASGQEIEDGQTGFRAFRKGMLSDLGIRSNGLEFETEMTIKAAINGYKVEEVPIEYRKRIGQSKLNPLKDGLKMLLAIIRSGYSQMSIISKGFAIPGLLIVLVGILFMLFSIGEYLVSGTLTHQYYPLIFVFFALAGTQLITLAVFSDVQQKKLSRIERDLASLKKK
jgi:glycosyltransferase involved in cell wall biosynthesis